MQYRRASGSGLTLPALSLGLWHNFGTDRDLDTQRAIVLRAFDLGITHFDLANNYGPPPGAAEETFGRILRRDLHRYRDEIVIATKAGYRMWEGPYGDGGSRKSMLASLHQSLSRLGVEYVDIFYSHRPDPNTPIEETMGALTTALQSGKALYPALSNYDAEQTRAAQSTLTRNGTPAVLHQTRYSMLDRTYEHTLQHVLTELSIGTTVFSPPCPRASHRPLSWRRHSRRIAGHDEPIPAPRRHHPDVPPHRPRVERSCRGTRANPVPIRADMGSSGPSGHVRDHWRKQR